MSKHRHKHNQQNKNTNRQNGAGDQHAGHGAEIMHVQGAVETHPAPTVIDKHDAERREDNAKESKKFIVEILSLVILSIYAGITLYSAHLTREITKENRAWVGMDTANIGALIPGQTTLGLIAANTPIAANLVIKNFGKSPAKTQSIGTKLEVRREPVPENYTYENEKPGMVIFPTQTAQINNAVYTMSDSEFASVKANDADRWENGILVFHGIIRYQDSWGSHTTKFCLIWRPSGPSGRDFNNCLEHSGAD